LVKRGEIWFVDDTESGYFYDHIKGEMTPLKIKELKREY